MVIRPTKSPFGYTLLADRDYKAGQEIKFSYDVKSNLELLAEYGFVIEKNLDDFTELKFEVGNYNSARCTEILNEDV